MINASIFIFYYVCLDGNIIPHMMKAFIVHTKIFTFSILYVLTHAETYNNLKESTNTLLLLLFL